MLRSMEEEKSHAAVLAKQGQRAEERILEMAEELAELRTQVRFSPHFPSFSPQNALKKLYKSIK